MGEARQTIDRMTRCMVTHDIDGLGASYAEDAVITTPDAGEIKGREGIVHYLKTFMDAFPDLQWEATAEHEAGDTAVDEGYVVGTNTGPMELPNGETLPPTGQRVRLRSVDIATVAGNQIVRHNFYFDQMDVLTQLGLAPPA